MTMQSNQRTAYLLLVAVAAAWTSAGAAAQDRAGERPMVALMTLTGPMPVQGDAATVKRIAETYRFISGHHYGSRDWERGKIGAFRERLGQHPDFHSWLGGKCGPLFEAGFDILWLDVTSSTMYNQADAYGGRVTQWDLEHDRQMDEVTYRRFQQRKLDALFQQYPQGKFWVNNVKARGFFGEAGDRHLLSGSEGHHPATGGSMENYGKTTGEKEWREELLATLDAVKHGWRLIAWSKGSGGAGSGAYRLFAYATFLLAWEPDAQLWFGGKWGGVHQAPDGFLYHELGRPLEHFATPDEAALTDVPGVYVRRYEHGLVLVNAGIARDRVVTLDSALIDPDSSRAMQEVTLPAMSAKILMKPD